MFIQNRKQSSFGEPNAHKLLHKSRPLTPAFGQMRSAPTGILYFTAFHITVNVSSCLLPMIFLSTQYGKTLKERPSTLFGSQSPPFYNCVYSNRLLTCIAHFITNPRVIVSVYQCALQTTSEPTGKFCYRPFQVL
jgi:hypothetical protein